MPEATRFDRDTAVVPLGEGRFEGRVDEGWWIERGPNGGYVAAILLGGLSAAVKEPARTPRSLTVHFTSAPAAGTVEIATRVERAGGSLTTVSARMEQSGRLVALALGAFSLPRAGPEYADGSPPEVLRPQAIEPLAGSEGASPPLLERFDFRPAVGAHPFSGSERAVTGGWMRLAEPRAVDPPLATLLMDAWLPALFPRVTEVVGAPTVDLTVHFRAPLPPADASPEDHLLGVFSSKVSAEGFWEEDGELWSPGGRLLAQSRQLALALPAR